RARGARCDSGRLGARGLRGGARRGPARGSRGGLRLGAHGGAGARVAWGILQPVKERLTGAIILVALIVLLVPELLTGPIRKKSAPAASSSAASVAAPLAGAPAARTA